MAVSISAPERLRWLCEQDAERLQDLWARADRVRHDHVGDAVHLRGLLEITNYCDRACLYCGLRLANTQVTRYRMTADEIFEGAWTAVTRGYGTVVMQAGEDPGLDLEALCAVIKRIKRETPLAVTLSLGERRLDELQALRRAGADRYLLRFETSNTELFQHIHPSQPGEAPGQRRAILESLRELGFEVGSGVMVGLPGQTAQDLVDDIALFEHYDLDMIGVGPYIPHPETPLGQQAMAAADTMQSMVRPDALTTYKMIALARLACPQANIPSTTALATIDGRQGQMLGLQRGANVIMPNLTPLKYRRDYQIYPQKAGALHTPHESDASAHQELAQLGRPIAQGRGDSPNVHHRVRNSANLEQALTPWKQKEA